MELLRFVEQPSYDIDGRDVIRFGVETGYDPVSENGNRYSVDIFDHRRESAVKRGERFGSENKIL